MDSVNHGRTKQKLITFGLEAKVHNWKSQSVRSRSSSARLEKVYQEVYLGSLS